MKIYIFFNLNDKYRFNFKRNALLFKKRDPVFFSQEIHFYIINPFRKNRETVLFSRYPVFFSAKDCEPCHIIFERKLILIRNLQKGSRKLV